MEGVSVKHARHVVEAIGKRAADQFVSARDDQGIKEAMANLSAHEEATSDNVYGNDANTMIFNLSSQEMDKYRLCAHLFNTMTGIVPAPVTSQPVTPVTAIKPHKRTVFSSSLQPVSEVPMVPHKSGPLGANTDTLDILEAEDDSHQPKRVRRMDECDEALEILWKDLCGDQLASTPLPASPATPSQSATPLPQSLVSLSGSSTPRPPSHAIISQPSNPLPPTPAIPSQPATPRPLSALPVLGPGFEFQADVLVQLKRIVSSETPGSLLVIQPTGSGKGKYASELAKEPNTLVLLLCPYAKVMQEALDDNPDSVEMKDVDPENIAVRLQQKGLLAVSSFEGAPKHRTKLTAIMSQGVRVDVVVDEIHTLQDSKQIVDGYRDFRSFWTLVAGVQPRFVLGLTATLRPRHETAMANACGLQAWGPHPVIRASCRRPAVVTSCHVYDNEAAAIQAIVYFRPQLLCVKSKADIDYLQRNFAIKKAYREVLPHFKELDAVQKVPLFECSLTNPKP
jgi:hypothetical protein